MARPATYSDPLSRLRDALSEDAAGRTSFADLLYADQVANVVFALVDPQSPPQSTDAARLAREPALPPDAAALPPSTSALTTDIINRKEPTLVQPSCDPRRR